MYERQASGNTRCMESVDVVRGLFPLMPTVSRVPSSSKGGWITNAVLLGGVWDMSRFIVIEGVHDGA